MENLQLRYFFILSLKEIALRRVAVNLWNGPDILGSIEKFSPVSPSFYFVYSEKWRETIESKVRDKMSELKLPKSLKEQVLHFIPPIGFQIKKWKAFHEYHLNLCREVILEKYFPNSFVEFDAPILSKLCWTTAGALDYLKTAKELVRCEMVDILKRYRLACLYCLDEWIPMFWEKLPEEIKMEFQREVAPMTTIRDMPYCFPHILKGEESTMGYNNEYTSFNQHAFHYSALMGNKAATEYFFRKLTQEEKDASVIRKAVDELVQQFFSSMSQFRFPIENLSDVLCYLLSQMDHEKQIEIFRENSTKIMLFFMDWPCQDIFLKNSSLLWTLLPPRKYIPLLCIMCYYIKKSKSYFANFFQEFFIHSPVNFKKLFVGGDCTARYFFTEFFNRHDSETVQVILRNVDAADRLRLVFSKYMFAEFRYGLFSGRMQMVEMFLREVTLSEEDKGRLIEAFVEFIATHRREKNNLRLQNQFIQLVKEISASTQRKRCLEEESLNKPKKLC